MTTITFNGLDDSEYRKYRKLKHQLSKQIFDDNKTHSIWSEIVGDDYIKEPLPTIHLLQGLAKRKAKILDNYSRNPNFRVDFNEKKQKDLEEVLLRIQRKEYVMTTAEMQYRKEYYSRWCKFLTACYEEKEIVK